MTSRINVLESAAERDYAVLVARKFPVVEIFGPTIQGEGALAGSVSHFIRFGGCDYGCAWCDSAPAVLPSEVRKAKRLNRDEIMERVKALPLAEWVTLSGGNPALHDLELLVDDLHFAGFKVAVETQGTRWKPWLNSVNQLTISPKPPSSGMPSVLPGGRNFEDSQAFMRQAHTTTNLILKVPIFDRVDFEWAVKLHRHWRWYPFYLSVVTLMGGLQGDFAGGAIDTIESLLARYRQVVDWTLGEPSMADVKVIPQLHVLLWAHDRGH